MRDYGRDPNEFPREMAQLQRALRGGATRRDLMRMLGAAGMATATAGLWTASASRAFAAMPLKGGDLRVAASSSSTKETLDPARFGNGTDYARGFMIYNGLTMLDGALSPEPALATDWSTSDGKTWVFKLREGVTFHDGKALTADDVIFSVMRHNIPDTASRAKSYTAAILEAKETAPLEVTFTLSEPNYDLPVIFGTFNLMIVPAGTTDFSKGIGTGPYKLTEFEPGVRSVAVRYDGYWKTGKQFVDSIEYFGLPDESSRLNALRAGEIHLTTGINPRSSKLIERDQGIELFVTRSGTFSDLYMQKTDATVGSDDFALGIKALMQRDVIRSSIYRDFAELGNDQPIAPSMKYFADLDQRAYDPEKAVYHLKKAGVMGQSIPLVASPGVGNTLDMALILQQAAKDVGLTIDVQRVPVDGYWSNVWMKNPFGFGTITQRPTADMIFSLCYKSDAPYNSSKWQNEKFDQLLLAARSEQNEDIRAQHYADMQAIVRDEAGTAIPVFFSNMDAHSSKLKGLEPIPTGNMMGYAFAENVWLDQA